MSRRIILDLSDLYDFLASDIPLAGIPRVTLTFAELLRKDPEHRVTLAYYDPAFGCYAAFPEHANLEDVDAMRRALSFERVRRTKPERYKSRPLRAFYHRQRVRVLRVIERKARQWIAGETARPRPERFRFKKGDVLLVLGAGWLARESVSLIEPLVQEQTLTPILLVHDLIPLLGIPGRSGVHVAMFESWLEDFARIGTRFITYSESTRGDLEAFLSKRRARDYSIETFCLPHEFLVSNRVPPTEAVSSITRKEYVLSVGPPLPKNGLRLAHAWVRLAREIGREKMPVLVFAGSGVRSDLAANGLHEVDGLFEFVFRPNDSDLAHLYKHAMFTVFPSLYEGWGLPVAESLWFGKFCVASNTSSMPEVGGALCDYFDPYDIGSMVDALRPPIVDREYLKRKETAIDGSNLITWSRSAELLIEAVVRLLHREITPNDRTLAGVMRQ